MGELIFERWMMLDGDQSEPRLDQLISNQAVMFRLFGMNLTRTIDEDAVTRPVRPLVIEIDLGVALNRR
jgi:hypothetical protein